MTEQERNQWMDKLEDLRASLAEATREYEAANNRVLDIEREIWYVECQFPECRFWPSRG